MRYSIIIFFILSQLNVQGQTSGCDLQSVDSLSPIDAIAVLKICSDEELEFLKQVKLGDSYFRNSNSPLAIVHYEKARQINSTDKQLLRNLSAAYEQTNNRAKILMIEDINGVKHHIINPSYRDLWVLLSYLLLITIGIFLFRKIFFKIEPPKIWIISLVLGTLFTLNVLVSFYNDGDYAIIIANNQSVFESTSGISETVSTLNPGYKVEIKKTIEEWSQIILATGQMGWIKNDAFIEI